MQHGIHGAEMCSYIVPNFTVARVMLCNLFLRKLKVNALRCASEQLLLFSTGNVLLAVMRV